MRSLSPTSFLPLLCGAATPAQAVRLIAHLSDPESFGGRYGLPNAARHEPAFRENVYWRGRIWPNVNFLVWHGLRRAGFQAEADALARQSLDLFNQSWTERRLCGENYGAETGEIDDVPGNDPFYTWGALLPLMGVAQVMDVSPWHGWELTNTGEDASLGPLTSPAGSVTVSVSDGALALSRGADFLFATTLRGRLTQVTVERGLVSAVLADAPRPGALFRLGPDASRRLVAVRLGGQSVEAVEDGACRTIALDGAPAGTRLDCHLAPEA